jgi:hypothetical protein
MVPPDVFGRAFHAYTVLHASVFSLFKCSWLEYDVGLKIHIYATLPQAHLFYVAVCCSLAYWRAPRPDSTVKHHNCNRRRSLSCVQK